MAYFTAQLEAKQLMQKTDKSLSAEANFLHTQWKLKCKTLYEYGNHIAKGEDPKIELWMIEQDIANLNNSFILVMNEMKRRFLP